MDTTVQEFEGKLNKLLHLNKDITSTNLKLLIVSLLKSEKSDEELEKEFYDLFGVEKIELIRSILMNRSQVVQLVSNPNKLIGHGYFSLRRFLTPEQTYFR
ncbi:hypothetical protein HELRODRAFT_158563 [Helobdella robusta]|uniref:Brr2 N-terminal helicase PWI domain-containing protein n=1 Tax=Helobdella robusta TaxID=6412 RepID=T1EMY2_HELRO|nr:hypothetical protein HELRODRAFT_158563 [Helobdella robusta]ESO12123.1 hypothetical protein HELRODRAFT_158563 [Helobdella robusta]